MPAITVTVELSRRDNPASPIKAHADVELRLDSIGSIHMYGFSVYHLKDKPPVVLPPAKKGERRSFPHIKLRGRVKSKIESAILREYDSDQEDDKD